MIYLGADHRGFQLKAVIKGHLAQNGLEFEDLGNVVLDAADDYPDFAAAVAKKVSEDPEANRGILLCGSGVGVAVVADKFNGVRAGLCTSVRMTEMVRSHDDINVLTLAADFTDEQTVGEIVKAFLETKFSGEERHKRRIEKIATMERMSN